MGQVITKMGKSRTVRLPRPDNSGNYWLGPEKITSAGGSTRAGGPCILLSAKDMHHFINTGKQGRARYFASLGDTVDGVGILMNDDGIRYFDTPQEALAALEEAGLKA